MSSVFGGENPPRRKFKVSSAMLVIGGLVGPKARPKGVVDGQLVNIPALLLKFDGVTFAKVGSARMVGRS